MDRQFYVNKSKNIIKSYFLCMRKKLRPNFGPMGLTWGHWGLYLGRPSQKYLKHGFPGPWGPIEAAMISISPSHAKSLDQIPT